MSALAFALARERALNSESARADSIAAFATGLLNDALPQLILEGNSRSVRVLLESADRLVSRTLTNSPAAELTVRDTLGVYYTFRLSDPISGRHQADRIESLLPQVSDDRLPPRRSRGNIRVDIACAQWAGGAVDYGRAKLEALVRELRQRGNEADIERANALGSLGQMLLSMNQPREAEPLLEEAYRLDRAFGDGYALALIRNGDYGRAEQVGLATARWFKEESANHPAWRTLLDINAALGGLPGYWPLVQAQCQLGKFREAETLVAKQLEQREDPTWSPAQIKSLKALQRLVQTYSGQWREAAPGLIALATDPLADVQDLAQGMAAAIATGDTNAYDRLDRWGRLRYLANAGEETAEVLYGAILLRPQPDDLSSTLPHLLSRLEVAKSYHWTADYLPFLKGQLSYRMGRYEEALRLVEEWLNAKSERPTDAFQLHYYQSLPIPDFWRSMILARLGRSEDAARAYGDGIQKLNRGIPIHYSVSPVYISRALQQEALGVLHSQGIAVPEDRTGP